MLGNKVKNEKKINENVLNDHGSSESTVNSEFQKRIVISIEINTDASAIVQTRKHRSHSLKRNDSKCALKTKHFAFCIDLLLEKPLFDCDL